MALTYLIFLSFNIPYIQSSFRQTAFQRQRIDPMSFSLVAFLWRKPGLTPDEFHHHYEKTHIPLLLRLLGPVFPISHTRFYLPRQPSTPSPGDTSKANFAPSVFIGNTDDFDYDVFASVIFEDEAAFDKFFARLSYPDVAKVVGEDEDRFLGGKKMVIAAAGTPYVTLRTEAA